MRDIALRALDTARMRGASYADVRLVHYRAQNVVVRNHNVEALVEDESLGFGVRVIVDHGNGFVTLYAHFSRFEPKITAGVKVAQGQVLGYGGHTGYATGDHLHFEVHYNGAIVNPLNYLP